MIEIQMTVSRIPCKADNARPCVAALLAVSLLPAPRQIAICELIPIPNPIAIAFEKFCTGKIKRQRGHGIFADLGNKETVHDIV